MQGLSDKEEIMLYWDDVSDSFDGWMNLLHQLGGDSFINFEQDIWETARTYETVPHFGNLRQHHLLERLQDTIRNRWPFLRTGFLINALDTHFYVNDEPVETMRDLDAVLGCHYRENEDDLKEK
ncbi:TPA: hypothetical protein WI804_002286 [Neisseria meningitidis]